jgi:hypothetical protein
MALLLRSQRISRSTADVSSGVQTKLGEVQMMRMKL